MTIASTALHGDAMIAALLTGLQHCVAARRAAA
jgi:hypothetical protein